MDYDKIRKIEEKKSIKQAYIDIVRMGVADFGSDIPIIMSLYVLLSQLFKKSRIVFGGTEKTLRLHFFWIQNMRSGKGETIKPMKDLCNLLGITWTKITTLTDAGLIGTIDQDVKKRNIEKKKDVGDEGYISPIIKGDLGNFDIIFFEESKKIVSRSVMTEDLLLILQEALDDPGKVRKKLAHKEAVEYECHASLFATTYFIKEIDTILLDQGFFQRILIYLKDMTLSENRNLRSDIIELYKSLPKTIEEYHFRLKLLADRLNSYNREKVLLTLDDGAIKTLHEYNKQFHRLIKVYKDDKLRILMGFSQTIIDLSVKIGGINALLEHDNVIRKRHIVQGINIIRECVNTVVNKLSMGRDERMLTNAINMIKILAKEPMTKTQLVQLLAVKLNCSKSEARNYVDTAINRNYLVVEQGFKNTKFIRLNI